jgi:hypothetical protein
MWPVACNTAAGERLGAEALSGLARAFFYAGARALLVSHWPVYSDAAVRESWFSLPVLGDSLLLVLATENLTVLELRPYAVQGPSVVR